MKITMLMKSAMIAALLFAISQVAVAQSESQATLRVEVRPEAALLTSPPSPWSKSAETSASLDVKLRLQPASYSILNVSGDTPSGCGLQVETSTGWMPVSSSTVAVRTYDRSGSFLAPLNVRVAPGEDAPAQPVTLLLRLTASDASFDVSRTVVIPASAEQIEPLLLTQAE